MNYYNVEFWKNAEHPRKGAPDKNKYEHAWTKAEAEQQARTEFGLFPERFEYPWACRVTAMSPEVALPPNIAMEPLAVSPSLASPDAGAASGAGAAEAPSAVADSAAPGDLVSDLPISDRAKSALAQAGIRTTNEPAFGGDLMDIPGVGPAVAREIRAVVPEVYG